MAAIRRGDIFQANICTRIEAELRGSGAEAWARLVEALHPARAAYLAGSWGAVLSLSPELFLRRRGDHVLTAPIKGTRPRDDMADDHQEADVLRASAKDEAENVMIVDLMRNDLGRVCVPGTVRAPTLLSVEPHPGVWHLVSYVEGELPATVSNGALLRATFPPGSVTGTPKVRAIELSPRRSASEATGHTGRSASPTRSSPCPALAIGKIARASSPFPRPKRRILSVRTH